MDGKTTDEMTDADNERIDAVINRAIETMKSDGYSDEH
jgi:hypothetical protein